MNNDLTRIDTKLAEWIDDEDEDEGDDNNGW
jgi:hypothetical protein